MGRRSAKQLASFASIGEHVAAQKFGGNDQSAGPTYRSTGCDGGNVVNASSVA
jgi:hypothetical protein